MKTFISFLFLFSFALFGQSQSIIQDQLKAYKSIQANSSVDISAKYAVALSKLLEAAQKAGDKAAEEAIRVELAGSGHPVKDDWILGVWTIQKSSSQIEYYTFTPDGKATYRAEAMTGETMKPIEGIYVKVSQTLGYKVDIINRPRYFIQDTMGRVEVLEWTSTKAYPDKRKARKFKATKVP